MSQIMRLRRRAGDDHGIDDANNGHRHEMAFVKNIRRNGLLHEADLLPDSYGGKFHPRAVPELLDSLPVITRALLRRKVTPKGALVHSHKAPKDVKAIFEAVEGREDRVELNLYLTGYDEDLVDAPGAPTDAPLTGAGDGAQNAPDPGEPGMTPQESPTR
jgi:succinate dehydrogenase / fumarate reductase iron-sulfur subunit